MNQVEVSEYSASMFRGLSPNVFKLGVVSFLTDVSGEMLYPILPIFLTTILGAPVEAVGFIEGSAEAVSSLLKMYAGKWSDRLGKRRAFVSSGYLVSAISKPALALATSWWGVFFARTADRFGKGIRTAPRDALLAESVEPEFRGKAFGYHRGMDTLGAAVGPLLALLLLNHLPMRSLFMIAFVPGIFAALLTLRLQDTKISKPKAETTFSSPTFHFRDFPSSFKVYLLGWLIFSIANSSDMFLILRANNLTGSQTTPILMYVFYNLTYALTSPYLGTLSDRIGRKIILIGGLVVFAATYLGFANASLPWHLWILFGIYGLYIAATEGIGKALAVDMVPEHLKGTALGYLAMITGLSTLVASTVAGLLWTHISPSAPFLYGSIGACASLAILALMRRN